MPWGVRSTIIYTRSQIGTVPGLHGVLCGRLCSQFALQFVLETRVTLNSSPRTKFTYVDGIHVDISNDPVLPFHVLAVDG